MMVNIQASGDPYYWSLELPRAIAAPVGTVLVGLFAATAGVPLWRMARRSSWRAIAPCAVLLSSQVLWFVAPWLVQVAAGRQLSPVYYSTGVLAFLHCAQYLWITSYYARRESGPAAWRPWRYAGVLVLGGIALFSAGPWLASTGLGHEFRDSVLIFVAVINLHHFIVDGAIWKLRDRRVAAILIDGEATPENATAAAARWRGPWRAAGWAFGAALMVVAAINALHELLTRESTNIERLALAGRLNPRDSRVAVRRAELLDAANRPNEALSALADFTAPLPANAAALRLYGALLISTGQLEAASRHYRTLQHSIGLDAESQVNLSVIAAERGHLDEASRALQAALRLNPALPLAHLNLAGVCLMRGEGDCALRHYEIYLGSPAVARDRQYATAALNAAAAAELAERPARAQQLLQLGTAIAARIGAQDLTERASRQAASMRRATSSEQRGLP
jgi:tetratricopeptide (TPR) repeat protein